MMRDEGGLIILDFRQERESWKKNLLNLTEDFEENTLHTLLDLYKSSFHQSYIVLLLFVPEAELVS